MSKHQSMERNIRLYPLYASAFNFFAWVPIFILYFNDYMSLGHVLQLEAIYYASVVVLEIPSGYFSDRIGRRPTLLISAISMSFAYLLFLIGDSFGVFSIAQILLAVGISFNSGTDTSFHYDSLVAIGQENEYGAKEAKNTRNGLLSSGLGAFAGGFAGMVSYRLAYSFSLITSLITVYIVFRFTEPVHLDESEKKFGFESQVRACASLLKKPVLAWIFAFSVLSVILNHIPYEFYQPWLKLAHEKYAISSASTSLSAGLVMSMAMILGAWAAQQSVKLRNYFGLPSLLIGAVVLQIVVIFSMSKTLHWVVAGLIIMRSVPRGLAAPPIRAVITPLVGRYQRATWFSIQSLVGRLSFSATLLVLSRLSPNGETVQWATLAHMLHVSTIIGIIGLTTLLVTISSLKN